jgi:hypothetical protein
MTWWLKVADEIAAMKALGRQRPESVIPESFLKSGKQPPTIEPDGYRVVSLHPTPKQPPEDSGFEIPTPVVETQKRDSFLRPTRKIGR